MPTYTQFSGTYIEVMDAAGMSYLYNSQTQEAFTIQMRADKTRDSIISYTHTAKNIKDQLYNSALFETMNCYTQGDFTARVLTQAFFKQYEIQEKQATYNKASSAYIKDTGFGYIDDTGIPCGLCIIRIGNQQDSDAPPKDPNNPNNNPLFGLFLIRDTTNAPGNRKVFCLFDNDLLQFKPFEDNSLTPGSIDANNIFAALKTQIGSEKISALLNGILVNNKLTLEGFEAFRLRIQASSSSLDNRDTKKLIFENYIKVLNKLDTTLANNTQRLSEEDVNFFEDKHFESLFPSLITKAKLVHKSELVTSATELYVNYLSSMVGSEEDITTFTKKLAKATETSDSSRIEHDLAAPHRQAWFQTSISDLKTKLTEPNLSPYYENAAQKALNTIQRLTLSSFDNKNQKGLIALLKAWKTLLTTTSETNYNTLIALYADSKLQLPAIKPPELARLDFLLAQPIPAFYDVDPQGQIIYVAKDGDEQPVTISRPINDYPESQKKYWQALSNALKDKRTTHTKKIITLLKRFDTTQLFPLQQILHTHISMIARAYQDKIKPEEYETILATTMQEIAPQVMDAFAQGLINATTDLSDLTHATLDGHAINQSLTDAKEQLTAHAQTKLLNLISQKLGDLSKFAGTLPVEQDYAILNLEPNTGLATSVTFKRTPSEKVEHIGSKTYAYDMTSTHNIRIVPSQNFHIQVSSLSDTQALARMDTTEAVKKIRYALGLVISKQPLQSPIIEVAFSGTTSPHTERALLATHAYNRSTIKDKDPKLVYLQTLPIPNIIPPLGYPRMGAGLQLETTLMTEMALHAQVDNNPENINAYNTFLNSQTHWFYPTKEGQQVYSNLLQTKKAWQTSAPIISDDPTLLAAEAIKKMMAFDLHFDNSHAPLLQVLSLGMKKNSSILPGNQGHDFITKLLGQARLFHHSPPNTHLIATLKSIATTTNKTEALTAAHDVATTLNSLYEEEKAFTALSLIPVIEEGSREEKNLRTPKKPPKREPFVYKKISANYVQMVKAMGLESTFYTPQSPAVYQKNLESDTSNIRYISTNTPIASMKEQLLDTNNEHQAQSYTAGDAIAETFNPAFERVDTFTQGQDKAENKDQTYNDQISFAYTDRTGIPCALSIKRMGIEPNTDDPHDAQRFAVTIIRNTLASPEDREVIMLCEDELLGETLFDQDKTLIEVSDVMENEVFNHDDNVLGSPEIAQLLSGLVDQDGFISKRQFDELKRKVENNIIIYKSKNPSLKLQTGLAIAERISPEYKNTLEQAFKAKNNYIEDSYYTTVLTEIIQKAAAKTPIEQAILTDACTLYLDYSIAHYIDYFGYINTPNSNFFENLAQSVLEATQPPASYITLDDIKEQAQDSFVQQQFLCRIQQFENVAQSCTQVFCQQAAKTMINELKHIEIHRLSDSLQATLTTFIAQWESLVLDPDEQKYQALMKLYDKVGFPKPTEGKLIIQPSDRADLNFILQQPLPTPHHFDPQGRIVYNTKDREGRVVTVSLDTAKNRPLHQGYIEKLRSHLRHLRKERADHLITLLEAFPSKGSIIPLQEHLHVHLSMLIAGYLPALTKTFNFTEEDTADVLNTTLATVSDDVMAAFASALSETYKSKKSLDITQINQKLALRKPDLLSRAEAFLLEAIERKVCIASTDSTLALLEAEPNPLTPVPHILHTDATLGLATWVESTQPNSEKPSFSYRNLKTYTLDPQHPSKLAANIERVQLQTPTLNLYKGLQAQDYQRPIKDILHHCAESFPLKNAFTYHMTTTPEEAQTQHSIVAAHDYNREIINQENKPLCYVQAINPQSEGRALGYAVLWPNNHGDETTLMSEMALCQQVAPDTLKIKPYKDFLRPAESLSSTIYRTIRKSSLFSQTSEGMTVRNQIRDLKQEWNKVNNNPVSNNMNTLARQCLQKIMAFDLHLGQSYADLVQTLSLYVEHQSILSDHEGHPLASELLNRTTLLEQQPINKTLKQKLQALAVAPTFNSTQKAAYDLKTYLTTLYMTYNQQGAMTLIPVIENSATDVRDTTKNTDAVNQIISAYNTYETPKTEKPRSSRQDNKTRFFTSPQNKKKTKDNNPHSNNNPQNSQ